MENNTNFSAFPKNFFWGAATAAHQVEGGNLNDWTKWEKANCQKLAQTAYQRFLAQNKYTGASLINWENIRPQAENPKNYLSGRACDHYHRFSQDFDLAKKLNLNAYRFSIEWSRIESQEGKFNGQEINHYREVLKALRDRQIKPFVTLWHFTLPIWVAKIGGWENPKAVDCFARYTKKLWTVSKMKSGFGSP